MAEGIVGESTDNAAQRVIDQIENDIELGDVYNRLTQNGTTSVSGLGGNIYKEGGQPEFLLKRKLSIPEELKLQIKNMRSQFSMGLFTEISRAWVIVDHDIFMWNYETNDDLAYFDAVQNTVLKIALVKVKPGIFSTPVNYGLIVGTIADLTLYPMVVTQDVSIDPSHYFKVALEHNTINDIICTDNGRIFFSADDKLYEFVYENQKGWFRDGKRCRIVNQSASILSTLIPFFGSSSEDIEQLSVDNSRHLLYCLGRSGSIQVFDLGSDGEQCTRACAVISGQIASQANLLTQYGHEESNFSNIVCISALESYQSNQLNLVAITSKGVRIYFSVLERKVGMYGRNDQGAYQKNLTQDEVRVQKLRVAHVRFAPGVVPASVYGQGNQGVSVAYADQGLCVMATVNRRIVWAMSDLYFPHSKFLRESKNELMVDGNVWAIAPLNRQLLPYSPTDSYFVPRVLPHNFLRQVVLERARLLVCSNEGIHEFEQFTPTDALWHALQEGGPDGRGITDLLREFGQTELLFLALRLLCSDVPKDERIKDKAAALFYTLKDVPTLSQGDSTHNPAWSPAEDSIADWANRIRSPLFASTPEHSMVSPNAFSTPGIRSPPVNQSVVGGAPHSLSGTHRHDALYLYFARLVSSIWTHPICKISDKSLVTLLSGDELDWLSNELRKLIEVMEKYRLLPANESGFRNTAVGRIKNDNANAERQSLLVLKKLVALSAETLSLWSIANSFDLHAVSAGMNQETIQLISNRRFYQLANESDHLNADLIRALIKYFLGDEAGTRELSDRLRKDCPTLYSADDACVTNAMEQLGVATTVLPGPQRRQLIDGASQLLASSILKVDLPSISQTLIPLGGYEQLVDLCLLRAKKEDPRQLALIAFNKGSCTDDVEMNTVLEKRRKAYKVFTDVLTELENNIVSNSAMSNEQSLNRDLMITRIISSEDELAHASLFRWMIEKNKSNLILQSKSPYVEKFLTYEISNGRDQRYLDLLWRWYEKSGNYDKAATLLARLADSTRPEVSLSQRFSYLSHAIMCAEASNDEKTRGCLEDLRDKVEVARIQIAVRDCLKGISNPSQLQKDAVRTLDGQILPLQDLLFNFAVPLELYKIQLSIYHCGRLYHEDTIMDLWEKILDSELNINDDPAERLRCSLKELYSIFNRTKYFPSEWIIRRLLAKGATSRTVDPAFYFELIKDIGMTSCQFLNLLLDEYRNGDPFWSKDEFGQKYIVTVGVCHVQSLLEKPADMKRKSELVGSCEGLLSAFSLDSRLVSATPSLRQLSSPLSVLLHRLNGLR